MCRHNSKCEPICWKCNHEWWKNLIPSSIQCLKTDFKRILILLGWCNCHAVPIQHWSELLPIFSWKNNWLSLQCYKATCPILFSCWLWSILSCKRNFCHVSSKILSEDGRGARAWIYQSCTEFSYFQTPSDHPMRSLQLDINFYKEWCS